MGRRFLCFSISDDTPLIVIVTMLRKNRCAIVGGSVYIEFFTDYYYRIRCRIDADFPEKNVTRRRTIRRGNPLAAAHRPVRGGDGEGGSKLSHLTIGYSVRDMLCGSTGIRPSGDADQRYSYRYR